MGVARPAEHTALGAAVTLCSGIRLDDHSVRPEAALLGSSTPFMLACIGSTEADVARLLKALGLYVSPSATVTAKKSTCSAVKKAEM